MMGDVERVETHRTKLELAIFSNDLDAVKQALDGGVDVHKQYSEGNTAFHLAISTDSDIEILRCLLEHGASLTLTNDDNLRPLECLRHGSLQTALNLLKLETQFDFRDENESMLLHMFMDRLGDNIWGIIRPEGMDGKIDYNEQDKLIELFWEGVLGENNQISIDINAQDKLGNTPLHIAAGFWPSSSNLKAILSHFSELNPFLIDCNGDTFLHVYFSSFSTRDDTEFENRFLLGHLRQCPKLTLKQLLNCQNKVNDTPLHVYFKTQSNDPNKRILQKLVEAGADLNIPNDAGETCIFCAIRHFDEKYDEFISNECLSHDMNLQEEKLEILRYLVENGADINKQNRRGESPIFITQQNGTLSALVDNGAILDIRNNLGQTPFLSYICQSGSNTDVIELLLGKGADVNAMDMNGSSALHYIAWNGLNPDIITKLELHGVKISPDKIGQLPCEVAYLYGQKDVFNKLCHCRENVHKQRNHFDFSKEVIEYKELGECNSEIVQQITSRFQTFRGDSIANVLQLPGFGPVVFEDEAEMIKSAVNDVVTNICKEIAKKEEMLSPRLMPSGSVSESTKIKLPDEFDFVCILDKITNICRIDEDKSASDSGFVYLKFQPEISNHQCRELFNEEGYLDTFEVRRKFQDVLDDVLQKEDIFNHPNISFVKDHFKGANCPTFHFAIRWIGCSYKNLVIDVDLVPACQIQGWWPKNVNLNSLEGNIQKVRENGALLMLQTELSDRHEDLYEPISKLRVSALLAEREHMRALPEIAKDAYTVSKILLDVRICPGLHFERDIDDVEVRDVITSYMIKMCMFHVFHTYKENSTQPVNWSVLKADKLYDFVIQIFHLFLNCSRAEVMASYIFPWQNVFTFAKDVSELDTHFFCCCRIIFAKLILMILGQEQDFKDINTSVVLDSYFHSQKDNEMTDDSITSD